MANKADPQNEDATSAVGGHQVNTRRAAALRARKAARLYREMEAELEAILEGREPQTSHLK